MLVADFITHFTNPPSCSTDIPHPSTAKALAAALTSFWAFLCLAAPQKHSKGILTGTRSATQPFLLDKVVRNRGFSAWA